MKTISVRDLQKKIRECVDTAQSDQVVITRHGKPAALMIGIEGIDWETVVLETNTKFWDFIQKRRNQPTISLKEMKHRLKK